VVLLLKSDTYLYIFITFKERFLKDIDKFDYNLHEIVTFDATSLYTSINTIKVISEILKIIYKNPGEFFKDKDENSRPLAFPDRAYFRKFLHNVLINYNSFESQIGIFKQRSDLAMESKSSPSLSNIFVDLLENSTIPKFIKSKKILHWSR
jgi:hypothetical protein